MPTLTNDVIMAAIEGFEAQKDRIGTQIADLRRLLKGHGPAATATPETSSGKRRKFSAETRKKMQDAQRARWAKTRGDAGASKAVPASDKPKRKLSAAGRKAIVAAQQKRWALKRAEAAKTKAGLAKKVAD